MAWRVPLRATIMRISRGGYYAYAPLNDDVSPSAGDYSLDLRLLGLGHRELVKGLLKIVEKGLPLCRRYHEMLVRRLHGAARVLLRPASGPADHFRDEVLKACRPNAVMRLVYPWVCIQAGIDHDPVDEVIYNGSDAVDTAEPVIKARRILGGHRCFLPLSPWVHRSTVPVLLRPFITLPHALHRRAASKVPRKCPYNRKRPSSERK